MDVEERSAGSAAAVALASGSGAARVFCVSQAWNAGAPLDPPLGSGGCLGHPPLLSHLLSFPISHPQVWGSRPAQRPEPSPLDLQPAPPLHFSLQLPPGLSAPSPSSPPSSPPCAPLWPSARPSSPTPSLSPLRPSSPSSSRPLPLQPAGPAGTRPPARPSPLALVGLGSAPGPPLPALGTTRRPLGSTTLRSLPGPPGQGASLARLAGDRAGSGRPSVRPSGEKLQIRSPGMGPAPLPLLLGLFLPAFWSRGECAGWGPGEGVGAPRTKQGAQGSERVHRGAPGCWTSLQTPSTHCSAREGGAGEPSVKKPQGPRPLKRPEGTQPGLWVRVVVKPGRGRGCSLPSSPPRRKSSSAGRAASPKVPTSGT